MRRGTKTVRCKFVEDVKNGLVKSRFVAAEVARAVRYNVHGGTALRMIISLVAMRDGKRHPHSVAFCDTVAAFLHATIDEVVVVLPPDAGA